MPTAEEMAAALNGDPWAVAANRLRQGVQPAGGRPEGVASQFLSQYVPHVAQGLATLPQRALAASEAMRTGGDYDPGPVLETALMAIGARMPFAKPGELGVGGGKPMGFQQGSIDDILKSSGKPYSNYLKLLAESKKQTYNTPEAGALGDVIANNLNPPHSGWQAYPLKPGFDPLTLDTKEWNSLPRSPESYKSPAGQRLGFNVKAFHGTKTPAMFDEFRLPEDELGIHFGSPKAAQDRIGDLWHTEHTHRVFPVQLRANNPLEMKDLGTWHPHKVADELARLGFPRKEINNIVERSNAKDAIKGLRDYIHSKGYDSIVYKNNVEDVGHKSYIMMDPARIRSPFAKFDPTKLSSRNLLAGVTGAAATPSLEEYVRALRDKK